MPSHPIPFHPFKLQTSDKQKQKQSSSPSVDRIGSNGRCTSRHDMINSNRQNSTHSTDAMPATPIPYSVLCLLDNPGRSFSG